MNLPDPQAFDSDAASARRRRPSQRRSEATVARIEAAARQVLATIGRDRFTTAQVAVEAGVSIGSVYTYFVDKVDILDQVWPERADTFLSPVEDAERSV
jgi:AcrR family transcriptional regulator